MAIKPSQLKFQIKDTHAAVALCLVIVVSIGLLIYRILSNAQEHVVKSALAGPLYEFARYNLLFKQNIGRFPTNIGDFYSNGGEIAQTWKAVASSPNLPGYGGMYIILPESNGIKLRLLTRKTLMRPAFMVELTITNGQVIE